MNELLKTVLSSGAATTVILLLLGILAYLVLRGRIKSIGKDGLIFSNTGISREEFQHVLNRLDKIEAALNDIVSSEQHKHVLESINMLNDGLKKLRNISDENDLEIKIALLRLQILSPAVEVKDKFKLFDEYKNLGGDSYIDVYMEKLKSEHLNGGDL